MLLVPGHEHENKPKHLRLNLATSGSTSLAPPGTGFVYVPIYMWALASAAASVAYTNGTGGSNLIEMKPAAGVFSEIYYWEEPSALVSNKAPVIVSESGVGVSDIHVWVVKVRGGAGQDGLGQ